MIFKDVTCPYCHQDSDIQYEPYFNIYDGNDLRLSCPKCDFNFMVTFNFVYRISNERCAPCQNGSEHCMIDIKAKDDPCVSHEKCQWCGCEYRKVDEMDQLTFINGRKKLPLPPGPNWIKEGATKAKKG